MGVEILDIYVGPAKEQSRVHRDALYMIEYFNNILHDGLSEVSSKSATFPVDDLKTSDVLIG